MKKVFIILCVTFSLLSLPSYAQATAQTSYDDAEDSAATEKVKVSHQAQGFKFNNLFDLSLAGGSNQFSGALSWVHFHGFGKKKKFKIGYGVRFTTYFGSDLDYVTAPAKLTSGQTGPQVLFTEITPESYDTFRLARAQVNALNASINLQYSFSTRFEVAFNIDAIGFSFGGDKVGKFTSSERPAYISVQQAAKPTTLNLLLVSDNDIGTLNSELYGRYWVSDKIGIKAGLGFLFTEYTTTQKLVADNDRWRYKSLAAMVGITFKPYK